MKALTCGPSFSEVLSDFNDTVIYPVGCEEFVIIRISVKCHISKMSYQYTSSQHDGHA